VKLSLEKVREWFTPIQACYYLFENADKTPVEELLTELATLINHFRLIIHVKKYHFEPVSYILEKDTGQESYLALLAYYNEHNYISLPAVYANVDVEWLEMVSNQSVEFRSLIPDVFNFVEEYKVDKDLIGSPFPLDKRLPKECNIHFDVMISSFELGFPKQELDQFIQDQLNPKNKIESTAINSVERDSMIKIIHALAKNGYRYPTHGSMIEMVKDFQLNSNGVSEKTLKKYLDEFNSL
jgi:hypothetical protein